jgi:hypothetical protein
MDLSHGVIFRVADKGPGHNTQKAALLLFRVLFACKMGRAHVRGEVCSFQSELIAFCDQP